jgi:hypothetical protein
LYCEPPLETFGNPGKAGVARRLPGAVFVRVNATGGKPPHGRPGEIGFRGKILESPTAGIR